MARRPPVALADYVIVGINPALIMVLIASLVFFLLEVFYQGNYGLRLNFIFAMFIMGAVAVCRLSMEEGTRYASMFGAPLAFVTWYALGRFVQYHGTWAPLNTLANPLLIALIGWLAYQLTWDCTLLDEQADTADQGLLQAVGVSPQLGDDERALDGAPADPLLHDSPDIALAEPSPPWLQWFQPSKQPHAHGVWVIYFSLGALPVFGLGQAFVASHSRRYVLLLLVLYVVAALALLMSTSFLGLRRYLRRRRLEMPTEMTVTWLGVGGVLIVAVVALALLLPRPGAELAVSQLPVAITSPDLSPSRWGVGKDGQKAGGQPAGGKEPGAQEPDGKNSGGKPGPGPAGERQGQSSQDQSSQDQSSQDQSSQGQGNQGQGNQGQGNQGQGSEEASQAKQQDASPRSESQGDGTAGANQPPEKVQQQQADASSPTAQPPTPPPAPLQLGSWLGALGSLLKLLLYALGAGLLAYFAWRYRAELHAAWQQLLKELQQFWERLFGATPSGIDAAEPAAAAARPPRPFTTYADPFASGQAARMNRVELIRYTFEALQAYGRERGCRRQENETPFEYACRLGAASPELGRETAALAEYYGQAAYGSAMLPATIGEPLRALWSKMRQPPVVPSTRS